MAPPTFVLHRILGNDLPPRHQPGQTYTNCRFILDHEPPFQHCEKRWIINRIFDMQEETRLRSLLEERRQRYTLIPFDLDDYARAAAGPGPSDDTWSDHYLEDPADLARHCKILYAMNNNAARNVALAEGRSSGKWALPLDANCIFDDVGWSDLSRELCRADEGVYAVPMYRLLSNQEYGTGMYRSRRPHEPQLVFSSTTSCWFDESYRWGMLPKIELIKRLQIPYDDRTQTVDDRWAVGYVLRLFSGVPHGEEGFKARRRLREQAIDQAFARLDAQLARRDVVGCAGA